MEKVFPCHVNLELHFTGMLHAWRFGRAGWNFRLLPPDAFSNKLPILSTMFYSCLTFHLCVVVTRWYRIRFLPNNIQAKTLHQYTTWNRNWAWLFVMLSFPFEVEGKKNFQNDVFISTKRITSLWYLRNVKLNCKFHCLS